MPQSRVSNVVLATELENVKKELTETRADLKEIKDEQSQLIAELARQKGLVGGIMLAISSISALLAIAWNYLKGG